MKKSEVFQILYSTLDVFLKLRGFKFVRGRQGFIRHFKGGYHRIIMQVTDYYPEYQITFVFGIRIDEVEKIVNPFSNIAPEGYRDSMTFCTSLGYAIGDHLSRFRKIGTEEEVMDVALEIISFFRDVGLPYFDTYSTIKAMDKAVNDNPYDPAELFIPNNWYRGPKGIVLAKLAGRPTEEFDKLATIYQLQLEQSTDTNISKVILPKYYKLVEHLRTLDTAELLEQKGKKSGRTVKA